MHCYIIVLTDFYRQFFLNHVIIIKNKALRPQAQEGPGWLNELRSWIT